MGLQRSSLDSHYEALTTRAADPGSQQLRCRRRRRDGGQGAKAGVMEGMVLTGPRPIPPLRP
eukprot:2897265-Pyramimonas_sp.AAC.1